MKRNVLAAGFLFLVSIVMPLSALAANYVKSDVFKQWLETGKPLVIVDIQPADDFEKQHFKGSIETNAFPAKTEEEKKRIDKALPAMNASKGDVVIICPRGRSGASNTYDYLKSQGVPENRLYILEGGVDGWPHKELYVKGR
jgi:rhodanese-related sulfurtransferase